jgi:hypothetical protein
MLAMRGALTAAFSAALFGTTTLDIAQTVRCGALNWATPVCGARRSKSGLVNLRQRIVSAVMAIFLGSCR